jgi:hypothetical protein
MPIRKQKLILCFELKKKFEDVLIMFLSINEYKSYKLQ